MASIGLVPMSCVRRGGEPSKGNIRGSPVAGVVSLPRVAVAVVVDVAGQ